MYDRRNDLFKNKKGEDIRREKIKFSKKEISRMVEVADLKKKIA